MEFFSPDGGGQSGGSSAPTTPTNPTTPTTPTTPTNPTTPTTPNTPAAPGGAFPFYDVGSSRWYRPYVQAAYEAGLVKGKTDTSYAPDGTLSQAEAVTLAARIYADAHGETVPSSSGSPWYKAAYDYCVSKGVITGGTLPYSTSLGSTPATRYMMAAILDGAIPEERMNGSVQVGSIPDVRESDPYGEIIYRWYRAGIVAGDTTGRYNGNSTIKRSEVAKILCTIYELAE